MRRITLLLLTGVFHLMTTKAQLKDKFDYPVPKSPVSGLSYRASGSAFTLWSPPAERAELVLYRDPVSGDAYRRADLHKSDDGVWSLGIPGDLAGYYYTFRVLINGVWSEEVPDPWSRLVGINGRRSFIGDLRRTDPSGWEDDKAFRKGKRKPKRGNPMDAVVYELQVRDATMDNSSGSRHPGKFLGLTEMGTRNAAGLSTGLDHLQELGVTHIHLLPMFDFASIDEAKPASATYNWGYDPLNYNAVEGSFATDPRDPMVRVRELKEMIMALHRKGLSVVMDVVYNHTSSVDHSSFNQLVPGYFYRQNAKGGFSNATACGNETASDRPMFRDFMIRSLEYWLTEFHLDGFRFDLMGVHDIVTMNAISKRLRDLRPDLLLYGEGWTAGACPLPDSLRALKANASKLDGIAVFSDDIRDGIKGSVFDHGDKGFVSGKPGMEQSIRFGVVGSVRHEQVDYAKVNYSKAPYAIDPGSTMTYCECHDNHTLWDKLAISAKDASAGEREEMHRLALMTVLTSQGIAFLHAGTEFLRSKRGVENSFESPDSINAIDWNQKTLHQDVFEFVKLLIQLRKDHPAFHMRTGTDIRAAIRFQDSPDGTVVYRIDGSRSGDQWKDILVLLNGSDKVQSVKIPRGNWSPAIRDNRQPQELVASKDTGTLTLRPHSGSVLYR
jgi:pullulanase